MTFLSNLLWCPDDGHGQFIGTIKDPRNPEIPQQYLKAIRLYNKREVSMFSDA